MDEKDNQLEKFKQAARELECDDDPERFAERMRKIAKAPPAPQSKSGSGTEALTRLPEPYWLAERCDDGRIAVSTHVRPNGYHHWVMMQESDLPEGLTVSDYNEGAVVKGIDVPSVKEG